MARNRMIKPEFWSSETLNSVSLESNLLFIGLWNFADDFGVLLNNDRKILGDVFPLRTDINEKHIAKWKQELIDCGVVISLEHNNKKLLIIKNWFEHQKVANPSKRSHIDDPTEDKITSLISVSLESNEGLSSVSFSKEKEKEKEKEERRKLELKLKEKEKTEAKIKYADYVNMKEIEYKKLIEKFGKPFAEKCIEVLNNYKGSTGKKYLSDYMTILNWVTQKVTKEYPNTVPIKRSASGNIITEDGYEIV